MIKGSWVESFASSQFVHNNGIHCTTLDQKFEALVKLMIDPNFDSFVSEASSMLDPACSFVGG